MVRGPESPRHRRAAYALALGILAALPNASCGGSQKPAQDTTARDVARLDAALQGDWVLQDFRPEQPLGPPFDQLVSAQAGTLQVHVENRNMVVSGLGFSTQRSYEMRSAAGDIATIWLYDRDGVGYEVVGRFMGNTIEFEARTAPWRGLGHLQRKQ